MQPGYIRKNVREFFCLVRFIVLNVLYTPITSKTKEETTMNKTVIQQVTARPYPNAADRQYRIDKAIDTALTAAAIIGLTVAVLFLMFV